MELETLRDIVCQQIDTLQNYFDACAGAGGNHKQVLHMEGNDHDLFGSNDGCMLIININVEKLVFI